MACLFGDVCAGPPAGLTNGWRLRVSARLRPQCRAGDFARRGALRHRRASGTMQASSPTKHRARSCRFYRIFPSQSGNAPLRLHLAAHPPPLAGEALGGLPPGRLPCKGSCRVSRLRGAVPCLANILPGRRGALRHRRVCGMMQASAPTKHRAKPCRVWRMFARAGEAGLPVRLKNQPHRAAHGAAGQNQFAREPPGRYTGAGGAVFAALTPRRPSP